MNADAGIVSSHAHTMRPATPQRTADSRRIEPTPMIAPVIVCVVLTGTPRCVAVNSEIAPAVSAANPPTGCRFHTRCPWRQETRCDTERPQLRVLDLPGMPAGHKVACHFAGELGKAPSRPVTAGLLGVDDQGNTTATPAAPLVTQPGYSDDWFKLEGART